VRELEWGDEDGQDKPEGYLYCSGRELAAIGHIGGDDKDKHENALTHTQQKKYRKTKKGILLLGYGMSTPVCLEAIRLHHRRGRPQMS
jgi:hypothetical protein